MGTARLDLIARLALIAAGAIHAFGFRHDINPDGITYLDMATLFAAGDSSPLDNATFSPLYALAIAAAFALFGEVPARELAVVHGVNFACYVVALAAFEMSMGVVAPGSALPPALLRGLGYALFAWGALKLISLSVVTPDMLLAAFFFAAAALAVRCAQERRWSRTLAFGLVLGAGYWCKAIFFYLSFVFLFVSFPGPQPRRERLVHTLVALLVFASVAALPIARISLAHGKPTVGESGRLNLIWWVTHQDDPPGHFVPASPAEGTPVHPLRILHHNPRVYAFELPRPVTYPLWYDPSWWHAGRVIPVTPGQVLRHVAKTAKQYYHDGLFRDMTCLIFGLAVFLLTGPLVAGVRRTLTAHGRLVLAGLTAPAMYALVHSEARYVASSFVLVWLALYASVPVPDTADAPRWTRAVILTIVAYLLALVVPLTAYALIPSEMRATPGAGYAAHAAVAARLRAGDTVGLVGRNVDCYWARLARARIVAEIEDKDVAAFWSAPPEKMQAILAAFTAAGAKVLVTRGAPPAARAPGWTAVEGTPYWLLELAPR